MTGSVASVLIVRGQQIREAAILISAEFGPKADSQVLVESI